MAAVFACNAYVDAMAPWALRKSDPDRMAAVLGTLVEAIRLLADAVAPVIPSSSAALLSLIESGEGGRPIAAPVPIFPRLELPVDEAGRMTLIDSHCHLNYDGLVERQEEVLAAARARGVSGFLNISTRQSEWSAIIAIAEREPDVWATVGVHPHEADAHPDLGAAALVDAAAHHRVIAIGECGLDYFYDKSDRNAQRDRFAAHIEAARESGLPLVVHTRDAEADTAEMLGAAVREGGVTGVLHCFTGSADLARKALDFGFFICLSGIVTFKNARDLQETAKFVPADRLLVETDSPFLAPVPNRGKTCEPAFVADTAAFVAALRDEPIDDLAAATTANFFNLFQKAGRMKVRILGCGTSSGVPRIGNDWGQCDPAEPKNRRTRSSILVESVGQRLLVDCGPDLREQLLAAEVGEVDAVIVTHDHADHVHGIDDLRPIAQSSGRPVPFRARPAVLDRLAERFRYAFDGNAFYPAVLEAEPLVADEFELGSARGRLRRSAARQDYVARPAVR